MGINLIQFTQTKTEELFFSGANTQTQYAFFEEWTCRDLNSAIASRKESDATSSDSNLLNE